MHKKRLDSWKAIAEFLGRSLRTVQRWHETNGLPVHHFGGRKGSVFAYEEEIDQWLAGFAEAPGRSLAGAEEALSAGKQISSELAAVADNMWETRSETNIQTIADLYRKAIDHDAHNAAAFTGLANAMVFSVLNDIMDAAIAFPCAAEALRRIPQLNSEHLEAKCPAAWIDLLYNRNWRRARAGFEEVARKRPTSFAFAGLAADHLAEGKIHEALDYAWEAWRANPLVRSLGGFLCWIMYLSGDFHRAMDLAAQIRNGGGHGSLVTSVEALVLVQDGPIGANLARVEKAASDYPLNPTLQGILGYAYGIAGQEKKARDKFASLARCVETSRKSNGYALALLSIGLDDRQDAISWLETAYGEGTLWSLGFRTDPMLRCFKGDPRFERLVGRIGAMTAIATVTDFPGRRPRPFLEGALAVGEN